LQFSKSIKQKLGSIQLKILTKTHQTNADSTTSINAKKTAATSFTAAFFYGQCSFAPIKACFRQGQKGFTLFEMIVVLLIISILGVLAVPSYDWQQRNSEVKRVDSLIRSILLLSRTSSLLLRQRVVVCGSSQGTTCDQQWKAGILSFVDADQDGQFSDGTDAIVQFEPLRLRYGDLSWKGFGNRSYIRYEATTGTPNASNGSITYCTDEPQFNRQLALSRMGRVRLTGDQNNDGLHEDTQGRVIRCAFT
jgi:type IV fimbrial biogenesis protein FimT